MGQAQNKKKQVAPQPERKRGKKGKGFGDLLIGQILVVLLLWFSVSFNESSKGITIVVTAALLVGVLFFSGRGFKELWMKNKKTNSENTPK